MSVVIGLFLGVLVMSPSDYLSRLFNQCENNGIITPTIMGSIIGTINVFNMVSPPSMLVKTRK